MVEAHTNLTNMFLVFMLICSVFYTFNVDVAASISCRALNEYRAGTECCPECLPGQHVVKDCTAGRITECSMCPDGYFQAGYNGHKQCSTCRKCDTGLGLKEKRSCSSTSDAVCEVLDGFFCSDSNGGGCRDAQRHRLSCSPGHYIGQRGTADKDMECLHCADGTFSDGTRSSCKNHTKCEGGVQKKTGTDSTDSICLKYWEIVLIIIGCISLLSIIVLGALVYRRHQKRKKTPEQKRGLTEGAAGEKTSAFSSTPLLFTEPPAGLETSSPPAPSSETQPAEETTPLKSTDGPEPTRDQQECTITIPDETMDDQDGDQSLGPALPSSPTHNGSLSVSVNQEDDLPVHTKRDNGASRSCLLSLGLPSTSRSSLLSLGLPSTSQSARRFRVRSKSVSSCLENPKLPTDLFSLLMDNDIAEEVPPFRENCEQPESESGDSCPKTCPHQERPWSLPAHPPWFHVRCKSVSSHFNIPSPGSRASLFKGNDIAEET